MSDERRPELSGQLTFTSRLRLAIDLLARPSRELCVDDWRTEFPELVELEVGEPDPLDAEEATRAFDPELPPWFPATEAPLPVLAEVPDVWVFGNPPQVRANRHAYPRVTVAGTTKESQMLPKALRQRAKIYEQIVRAVVELRPELGVSLDPDTVAPVGRREIADKLGCHLATVDRVSRAVRFQNLHMIVGMTLQGDRVGFTKGASPAVDDGATGAGPA